jgi:cytochrome c oxidase cbb3-type subunit 3
MIVRRRAAVAAVFALSLLAGCDRLPGKPKESQRPLSPAQVKSFDVLYTQNCAGCHGAAGNFGAATELANPAYQALVDDATLSRIIRQGVPATAMPSFAQSAGGYLTDAQIAILIDGMRARWKSGPPLKDAPPYAAAPGDPAQGAQVFARSCASCHGPDGKGGARAPGSIVDRSYLMLVSDQALRTLVIAGRRDLGHPDWRQYPPGQPLTAQQVADVVAWLAAKRPRFAPGTWQSVSTK